MQSLASLGPHVFQVIGLNFHEVETVTEAAWAEFARFGMADGAQFTGMRRAQQTLRGVLFPDAIGGLADYDAIRSTQGGGQAVPLIRMGRGFAARVLGTVTIEQVSDLEDHILAGGVPARVAFTVTLKSYEGGR
ncbi:hypothetical protein C3941_09510 [Kaistia algarum]|uniref:phage tail protein n=1 Tax=Kaistia algarum TaxID=2083279 RepID=UPI000CE92FFD|nr:phage tail protein [Kaistia algarum]MCX5512295.1 phage tail protein [Kaistia algarum]PPE80386.1 hypothetical protein C3941_09510 [Kaistia algarum]